MELADINRYLAQAEEQLAYWKLQKLKFEREFEKSQEKKDNEYYLLDIKELCDRIYSCDLSSKRRDREPYAWGRHVYCYVAREFTSQSLASIGKLIDRNHATVINSHREFENLYDSDYGFTKFADQVL